jgi:hypothetical protein
LGEHEQGAVDAAWCAERWRRRAVGVGEPEAERCGWGRLGELRRSEQEDGELGG